MKPFCILLGFSVACASGFAEAIEEWVEHAPQPEIVQEWLDDLREHPLDLNQASRDELLRLPFFDEASVRQLLDARNKDGDFRRIEDVLRMPEWSEEQREVLRRYTTVVPRVERARLRATSQVRQAAVSSFRASFSSDDRTLGFIALRQGASQPQALQDVSVGVAYTSVDAGWRVVAGDYQFESGTGLVFGSAYGSSSWLARGTSLLPSRASGLKSKPTRDKLSLFRGAGVQMKHRMFDVTALVSDQRLDAVISDAGAERITEGESLTPLTEAARDNQVGEQLFGAEIAAHRESWRVSMCGARSLFSPEFAPAPDPEQPFALRGRRLDVGGATVSGEFRELEFVAEAAHSNPGGSAARVVVAMLRRPLGLSIYHSYASPDFFSLHSKAWSSFGDEAVNSNRAGVRFRFASNAYSLGLHAWSSRTPFRTANLPLRKTSGGIDLRSTLPLTPVLSAEVLAGRTWNEDSGIESTEILRRTDRARLELTIAQAVEFKLRFEWRSVQSSDEDDGKRGSLLFFQTKYPNRLATLHLRVTFFDIESGEAAIRAYEMAPLGAFPLVTFSSSGRRVAGMLSRDVGPLAVAVKLAEMRDDSGESLEGAAQLSVSW